MNSEEIRQKFLDFFEKRGHAVIPSASLVPENDPSVLFNTAGMQPLVPYLLGAPHPKGKRLVDVQKCVRTQDIDEVGDATHDTFFEMLGNWSLGDYFKEDAIKWSYELLTSKEGFGLDPNRLYITCFEGDSNAPKDLESFEIWKKVGIPENRIYFLGAKSNWWSVGDDGPCGPDTEMFYDITKDGLGDMTKEKFLNADTEQNVVEIWNDVFMEYMKKDGKVTSKLQNKNVDTGAGLERLAMVLQKKDNIFDTDLFLPIIQKIILSSKKQNIKMQRIVADHIRTAAFIISDGVRPSNSDSGYVLRRLIRRVVYYSDVLGLEVGRISFDLATIVVNIYKSVYKNLDADMVRKVIFEEEEKFRVTLSKGLKEFEKIVQRVKLHNNPAVQLGGVINLPARISGKEAFDLFQTYGFPIEITIELAKEKGIDVAINRFEEELKKHQELSKVGSEKKFKGGLGGTDEKTLQYHTTTHLLQQALRDVLGNEVGQKGSNITPERLRFDFTFSRKMTDEEKKKVEDIVNEKIKATLPVQVSSLPKEEAEKTGAIHFFGEKYPDVVTVYYIGDDLASAYSKEFCGGPHVKNTSEIKGTFKIAKEEAVAQGVRRIKAILE